jgi:hypothetical protein
MFQSRWPVSPAPGQRQDRLAHGIDLGDIVTRNVRLSLLLRCR